MAYEAFAGVYDAFNEDADYDALFRYVCGVLRLTVWRTASWRTWGAVREN